MIFNREPASWANVVSALLVMLVGFGLPLPEAVTLAITGLVLVAGDLIVAIKVRPVTVPVISAVVKAILVLALALGAPITPDQTTVLLTFTTLFLGFVGIRPQVTPVATLRELEQGPDQVYAAVTSTPPPSGVRVATTTTSGTVNPGHVTMTGGAGITVQGNRFGGPIHTPITH